MTNRSNLVFPLIALFLTACLAGCGNNSSSSSSTQSNAGGESGNAVTIHLTGGKDNQMTYDKSEFTVPSGATVKLVFKNLGTLPASIMGHDVVILKDGVDAQTFGKEITKLTATNPGEIPASMVDKVLAHTKLLGPGETDTITFTAPAPGTYEYVCSYPGHFATMNGKMIVK